MMKQQHAHTLQALFSHPLQHGLRMADVEALLLHLGASVEHLSDHRLKLELSNGNSMVLHAASGPHHAYIDEEGVLRLRRFLQQSGITPQHPTADSQSTRGDQSKRLVIHLNHRGARLWWLGHEEIETKDLKPNNLWNSHQRLNHRHDRDVAGQRAPLDYAYLNKLSEAVVQADRVLLLGHGHGSSDMCGLLKAHLDKHNPSAGEKVETKILDDTSHTDSELLAISQNHFGNVPRRSTATAPGGETGKTQTT